MRIKADIRLRLRLGSAANKRIGLILTDRHRTDAPSGATDWSHANDVPKENARRSLAGHPEGVTPSAEPGSALLQQRADALVERNKGFLRRNGCDQLVEIERIFRFAGFFTSKK